MNCDQVKQNLALYVVDALSETEQLQVVTHLTDCAHCQALLAEYELLVSTLPEALASASTITVPDQVKSRILALIEAELTDTAPPKSVEPTPNTLSDNTNQPQRVFEKSWITHWRQRPFIFGSLALALLLIFLFWNLRLTNTLAQERALLAKFNALLDEREIILEIVDSTETTKRFMRPTVRQSEAPPYGKVYTRDGFHHVVAMAARLPIPLPGQAYHLWLTRDNQTFKAGTLTVNEDGFGLLVFDDPNDLNYDEAFVTLQAIDSTVPSDQPLIRWQKTE